MNIKLTKAHITGVSMMANAEWVHLGLRTASVAFFIFTTHYIHVYVNY